MLNPKTIMMVDDNISNLRLGRNILGGAFNVFTMLSGDKLFAMLERVLPDLFLLDVIMPDMGGYKIIRRLKADPRTVNIPVIFLSAKGDLVSELEGLTLGAVDYIAKPFSPPLLLKRVENHLLLKRYSDNLLEMVAEKTRTITELRNALLATVAEVAESRDNGEGGHVERTQEYLARLLKEVRRQGSYAEPIGSWDEEMVVQAALLHDVGKVFVPDSVRLKPGKLEGEELEVMKKHIDHGVALIGKVTKNETVRDFLYHAKIFAESHHERWDGSGYPSGLSGEAIPLQGRLMAIVDVYDALVNERPYKRAFSHREAVEIILAGSGTHFDPILAEAFMACADDFARIAEAARK